MRKRLVLAAVVAAMLLPAAVLAAPDDWHKNPEEAQLAARKSGKPLLVVTTWKDGV